MMTIPQLVDIGEKIIFRTIVGSQAYGTNVEGSDIDIKGVYIQDMLDVSTYNYKPQIEVNKDEVYYEIRRFIELLGSANPTVLEMLYSPEDCILECTEEFKILLAHRDLFLTKKCKNSFGGYAVQQIKKARGLDKKMNWEKEEMTRKTPLDFCHIYSTSGTSMRLRDYLEKEDIDQQFCGLVNIDNFRDAFSLYWDFGHQKMGKEPIGYRGISIDNSNSLRASSIPKGVLPLGIVSYNKDAYTQHCNKWKEYQTWLKERNTQRYVDIDNHGQKIDGKNMLHCMRLIDTALEISVHGKLNVRRTPDQCIFLKSIRHGKVDLNEILETAENLIKDMDMYYDNSTLPEDIQEGTQQELLTKIRLYKP